MKFAIKYVPLQNYMRNILFIVLAALIAASCGNKEEKTVTKAEGLDFDSITVDTIAALIQEEGSPSANIHVTMMYAQGDKGTAFNQTIRKGGFLTPDYMGMLSDRLTMKQAVDSFVISYVNDYKRDYAPLFRGHRGGIVCYIARSTMYGGGEHSVTSTIAKNIEVKTGKVITAADVFAEGFEQPLADLIVKKLCKMQDVKTLKELQEKGFFVDIEPYASDNFILGDGEITFIYVDSEIAPHEAGEIRVTLNDDELESVVK